MFDQLSRQPIVPAHNGSAPENRFGFWFAEFDDYMLNERGLSVATRRGRLSVITRFLSKMVAAGDSPTVLTIRDVDAFLQSLGEQGGHSRESLQMVAGCLRAVCRYGATRGWCRTGLAEAIKSPRVYSLASLPTGPSWEDVKRLLALTEGDKPTDIRARAILMLLAIYGLRAGEVRQLRLDDFDWNRELLLVSHSKSRRTRMFPLSRPVGDAVLLYIKEVRPRTRHREVFLTLDGRPLKDIYMIVSRRLRRLQTDIPHHGPHALRHACATHLLAEGCSLKQIGDQLGHQDADSTRIYAKVDISGLRKVADVDLGGLV
jgi:integrase/recombinase XerD